MVNSDTLDVWFDNFTLGENRSVVGIICQADSVPRIEIANGHITPSRTNWETNIFHRTAWSHSGYFYLRDSLGSVRSRIRSLGLSDYYITYGINPHSAYVQDINSFEFAYLSDTLSRKMFKHKESLLHSDQIRTYDRSLLLIQNENEFHEFHEGRLVQKYLLSRTKSNSLFKPRFATQQINPTILQIDNNLIKLNGPTGNISMQNLLCLKDIRKPQSVVISPNGHILVGASFEGLYLYRKHQFKCNYEPTSPKNQNYYSILDVGSRLLCSTGDYFDPNTSLLSPSGIKGLGPMTKHKSGYILAIGREGLFKIDSVNVELLDELPQIEKLNFHKLSLALDFNNHIWISDGEKLYNLNSAKTFDFPKTETRISGSNLISFPDSQHIWIATFNGLYEFNSKNEVFSLLPEFANHNVRDILQINDSLRLIATYDGGLKVLKNRKIHNLPSDRFELSTKAHRLIDDDSGSIWLSTNKGLFSFNKKSIINHLTNKSTFIGYRYFDKTSGFSVNEFNGGIAPSGIKFGNHIYFPSLKGIVYFNPDSIPDLEWIGKPLVECTVNDIEMPMDSIYKLPPVRSIVFNVYTPCYEHQNNAQLWYQLVGDDIHWQKLPKDGSIRYTNLFSGKRIFKVARIDYSGQEHVQIIQLDIAPYWYETKVFYITLFLLAILLGYLLFRWRLHQLKQNQKQLEQKIEDQLGEIIQKNKELEILVDKLRSSERSISKHLELREKLIAILSHDALGSLHAISSIIKRIESTEDLSAEKQKSYLKNSHQTVDQLYSTMHKMLSWIKLQREEKISLHIERFNLKDLIDEILQLLNLSIISGHSIVHNQISANIYLSADKQVIRTIIHNLLENEFKHNPGVSILINTSNSDDFTWVKIINKTHAISNFNKINQFFASRDDRSLSVNLNFGLGLLLTKELLYLSEGQLNIKQLDPTGHVIWVGFSNTKKSV